MSGRFAAKRRAGVWNLLIVEITAHNDDIPEVRL
jgi:hypothetical protein